MSSKIVMSFWWSKIWSGKRIATQKEEEYQRKLEIHFLRFLNFQQNRRKVEITKYQMKK